MTPEAYDFLTYLRRGPVHHQEAAQMYGAYAFATAKRSLAGEGHLVRTTYRPSGTVYELARDADRERLWESGAA